MWSWKNLRRYSPKYWSNWLNIRCCFVYCKYCNLPFEFQFFSRVRLKRLWNMIVLLHHNSINTASVLLLALIFNSPLKNTRWLLMTRNITYTEASVCESYNRSTVAYSVQRVLSYLLNMVSVVFDWRIVIISIESFSDWKNNEHDEQEVILMRQ